jgi:chaperonin GroES
MSPKIKPVEYKVLIKPEKIEDRSAGGIYLPDSARERQQYAVDRGEIVAIGEGFFGELPGPKPKVGDRVIYNKYAGSLITIGEGRDRTEYRLINDKDICAIVEEEGE